MQLGRKGDVPSVDSLLRFKTLPNEGLPDAIAPGRREAITALITAAVLDKAIDQHPPAAARLGYDMIESRVSHTRFRTPAA